MLVELKEINEGQQKESLYNSSPNKITEGQRANPPETNNPLLTFSFSLSQSSNPDINELLNTEPLDSSDVDPKSWDSLYSSVTSMSPITPKSGFLSNVVQSNKNKDREEGTLTSRGCYDLFLPNNAPKQSDLVPSQKDSGLGDNSMGSNSDSSTSNCKGGGGETRSDGNDQSVDTGPRYPKRSLDRLNYKELEVPEDDEFICKYFNVFQFFFDIDTNGLP